MAVFDRLSELGHGPSVDLVVSNAGVLGPVGMPLWEADLGEVRSAIDTNLFAHMALAHRLLPTMVASGTRSRYVFTGSMAAFASGNRSMPYAATKSALVALARGLATELDGTLVRPAVVCPGFVRTPMTQDLAVPAGAGGNSELTPQQVADAVIAALPIDDLYIFPSPDAGERLVRYTEALLAAATTSPERLLDLPAGDPGVASRRQASGGRR
jgi:NAD(P)-dependent dehydrogenase (short-subunit alcohol dehydrogenase family)